MKILAVHETCGWQGGVEQHLAVTAPALRARGHRVVLAWRQEAARDAAAFARLFDEDQAIAELGLDQRCDAFDRLLDRECPDVVWVHKAGVLPSSLTGRRAVRVVRYVHDHDLTCPRRHRYTTYRRHVCRRPVGLACWLDAAFVKRPGPLPGNLGWVDLPAHAAELRRNHDLDRLLVGSRAMRDELLTNGFPSERVHVLAPVLPRPPLGARNDRLPGCSPGGGPPDPLAPAPVPVTPRVLFVGQLVAGKGVDLLLKALVRVPGPWRLDVVGEGNARPALELQSRRLHLADRVRFLGWRDHQHLGALYAAARVVAVPSRWAEPFGMIGLEAMHAARAVVAFDVGGIPDWCEPGVTGLLAPEGDVPALAEALTRALYMPGLAERLGQSGRARVDERFTFEGMLDALERHLEGTS